MENTFTADKLLDILVIDDHESVLGGTVKILQNKYPQAKFITAITSNEAIQIVAENKLDLIVMDLSIPLYTGVTARPDHGIQLLKNLMTTYPDLNIVVQSAHVRTLIRIRLDIDNHKGGFTIADKSLSTQEMLIRVDWALQGLTHIKDIKTIYSGLELKPEWLQVLNFAFEAGLQDKTIAEKMNVSERMVRHYWSKLQDALNVYPEPGKNIRIQTEKRAREEGLID
ncbi:MAG: DNA-binding response regulator [Nostocales cyanobacterium]|nr:MAG: DNA-binding response regulator [Nostocales cyanobacterium]TAF19859.1 MAG: DNA-binding response regulator [Nostocales cyanobacterium]